MSDTKKKIDMVNGNPVKSLILFCLPMILGNLFQQCYSLADSIIVGRMIDANALAAVGASTSITMLFVMVGVGTGIGCTVVISQLFGAKRIEEMKSAISTAFISITVFALVLSVLGRLLSRPIIIAMQTPTEIQGSAEIYLNIYFYGFFFLFLYNAANAVFNGLGDSKMPLIFLAFSSVLNIGLDILFVQKWDIAGAAWATFLSQALSAILSIVILFIKLQRMKSGKFAFFDRNLMARMLKVAFPSIIQQSVVSIGMLLIQAAVNMQGPEFVAGYTAAIKIDGMAIVPMVNVGNAVSTFTAQNIGAQKNERVPKGYHTGLALAAGIAVIVGILLQIFGGSFVGYFMDPSDPSFAAAVAIGAKYISVVSMFYWIMGAMNVSGAVLRGAGDMKWFLGATLANLAVRVTLTYILRVPTDGYIIMYANPIGWAVSFTINFLRYRSGKWKNVKLI